MRKFIVMMLMALGMASCSSEHEGEDPYEEPTLRTLFVYMPWSGDLDLNFRENIDDMKASISEHGVDHERVIVFFSNSSRQAIMYEIVYNNGSCTNDTLKRYDNPEFTTVSGLTEIIGDMMGYAPAEEYSMIIGGHGRGWIPVGASTRAIEKGVIELEWNKDAPPITRYFGGTQSQYQTDISTLAEAIANNGVKMEYILFDDCYMANVEVAYELKDATDYLIASTCEIMAHGMPYDLVMQYLMGTPNYEEICNGFYNFYSSYRAPYGTLSVTDCSQIDEMADIMKTINGLYTFDESLRDSIQKLDGYSTTVFFDYGDYVAHLCADPVLLEEFNEQLERTVPYKVNTEYYYSSISLNEIKIDAYSGLTTSDPSAQYTEARKATSWYAATH